MQAPSAESWILSLGYASYAGLHIRLAVAGGESLAQERRSTRHLLGIQVGI